MLAALFSLSLSAPKWMFSCNLQSYRVYLRALAKPTDDTYLMPTVGLATEEKVNLLISMPGESAHFSSVMELAFNTPNTFKYFISLILHSNMTHYMRQK
jgi:hypothetical protein